ncbi:MAG: FAD-dependent oxidoreductase [Chloroflexota bacterium]|nr:FAD-dependent oxidoreductase [Chloroflexota bacterium]
MMDAGRHPNITLLSYSEVEDVSGYVGNFEVKVRRKPRYVLEDKCTSCGLCLDVCPISVNDEFNEGLATHPAIYRAFAQAIPSTYVIDKQGVAPCRDACPTGQRAQGYIALIREGRFADAYRTIKEDNPFPAVCGRVCNHVCEDACSRGKVDEPVSIMRLKRFAADWAFAHPEEVAAAFKPKIEELDKKVEATGKKVAIVGSGPAGLTVAQDLKLKGHDVTVFESLPVAGGMMRVGIPEYRLPREMLQREIEEIIDLGVELKLNTHVEDVAALKDEYEAVFVAIGAHDDTKLRVPGVDLPQMLGANDFLRDASLERYPDLMGKKVIVLGGGDVAMDSACTAIRIGTMQADEQGGDPPEVRVAYRRTEAQMPAQEAEFRQAQEDGVIFDWLVSPVKVVADDEGQVCGLNCCRMELGEPDESGRRRPIPIEGSEFLLDADVVISAIGANANLSCVPESIERTPNGRQIAVDENTMMTNVEGIFAAGDAVTGMAFVVDAIGTGHKAARAMDAYLRGLPLPGPEPRLPVAELTEEDIARKQAAGEIVEAVRACSLEEVLADKRIHSMCEVSGPVSEEEAIAEAERCLQCGICSECNQCVLICGPEAIDHRMSEEVLDLEVGTVVVATGYDMWDPTLLSQYSYGKSPNIITGLQFERLSSAGGPTGGKILTAEGKVPERVAVIHCVGSRDHNAHEYCSRFCCMYSLKQAHLVRDKTGAKVYEFYMDMRTFGEGYEEFYERVQKEEGITMVRGRGAEVAVLPDGKLRVKGEDADLGQVVHVDADMVVISTAVEAPHDADEVASLFGLGRKANGFFAEAHPKLRPVETNTEGVFLAGVAQGPKDVPDTVAHAGAAASMALALLDKGEVTISPQVAVVNEELCSACKTCISLCPYTAISFIVEENVARVNEALCKGCGTCVAACPAGAIDGRHFTTEQIMAQIEGLFRLPEEEPIEVEAEVEGVPS